MERSDAGERAFAGAAGIALLASIAANERALAALAPDGLLEPATRLLVRAGQGALALLALGLWLGRARLARLFARDARALRVALALGIALRVALFPCLGPDNNDPHRAVVEHVVEHGWTPAADQAVLGFQPPLYYLMAAPWALGGSAKRTQLLSLLLSIANLVLLHRLVRSSPLLQDPRARVHAFLLLALLPQLAIFGLFVSNDALAFPLGTLLFAQWALYAERPSAGRLAGVGAGLGLGLLTKGTFTAFVPPACALVLAVGLRERAGARAIAGRLALVLCLTALVGGYKFVENQVRFGTPVPGNDLLHQAWVERQRGTVQGASSFVDVDLPRLVRHPYASEETRHSLPLLFYGTFWYSHIAESNLQRTRRHPFTLVPRAVYVAGVLPTLVMALGLAAWAAGCLGVRRWLRAEESVFRRHALQATLVLALLLNAATVLSWGLRHDAWSFFQSRLVFPAALAVALLLGLGFEALARRAQRLAALANVFLLAPWIASLAWMGIEIASRLAG